MKGYSYYPTNPDWNDAAVVLNMLSQEQLAKVINLVNARGSQLIVDLKGRERSSATSLSPLAILDSKFVPSEDMEMVALGMSTVLLNVIRKPKLSQDSYESVLRNAFAIPDSMAAAAAKRIETEDVLGASYKDPSGGEAPWYSAFANSIKSAVRKTLNAIPEIFGIPWEIDQTQDYDLDLLYEWKLLGETVADLNSRTRLMAGQAALNMGSGLFAMGDIENEIGDVEAQEMALGDAISTLNLRRLPAVVFGSATGLKKAGEATTKARAQELSAAAGLAEGSSAKSPAIKNALAKALNAKPSKALAAGALLGLTPAAVMLVKEAFKRGLNKGDIEDGDTMNTIASNYGQTAAHNWLAGDVEGFLREVGALAAQDVSTGDPDVDSAIEAAVMEESMGDVEDMGPEIGGIFTRARINAKKKQYARRQRRTAKKMGRQTRKNLKTAELQKWKDKAAYAGFNQSPREMDYNPNAEFENEMSGGGGGDDMGGDFSDESGGGGDFDMGMGMDF